MSTTHQVLPAVLILIRMGALLASMTFTHQFVLPLRSRIAILFVLAFVVAVPTMSHLPQVEMAIGPAIFQETIIGLGLGLAVSTIFVSMQIAGNVIAQSLGLNFAGPSSQSSSDTALGNLFSILAVTSFFLMGGHRQIVAAAMDSLEHFPPGTKIESWGDVGISEVELMIGLMRHCFEFAVRIARPVMICMVFSTLATGLLSRIVQYFNFFSVGFNVNAIVLLLVLLGSLTTISILLDQEYVSALERAVNFAAGN